MDVKDIFDSEDGDWYKIPDSNVRIKIKLLRPKRISELTKMCRKNELSGGMDVKEVLDSDKLSNYILDESVIDWENITKDGEPLPVNTKNKIFLDENWREFNLLWNTVYTSAEKAKAFKDEELEGNSSSGPSSSPQDTTPTTSDTVENVAKA